MASAVAAIASERDDVEVRMLDLREIQLPWFDEPKPPSAGDYQHEHTREWARTINDLDAVLVVTAQYNGGYPAPLKNAIDSVYAEWNNKPVLLVSYGGRRSGGGRSSSDQLRVVFGVVQANLLESGTNIPLSGDDYAEPGSILKDATEVAERHRAALERQIDELVSAAKA